MATSDARTFADQDLASRHRKVMAGGNTRSTLFIPPSAPYLVSGSGSCVVDTQGHETLDLSNNYTALIHGHAFAPVVQAATTQIHLGSAFGLPTESEIVLAETLSKRSGLPKWRFKIGRAHV